MVKIGDFELNRCYFDDCIPSLKRLPSSSFDLCIADPPWQTGEDTGFHTRYGKKTGAPHIDYQTHDIEWHLEWIKEARRVSRILIVLVPLKEMNTWVTKLNPNGIFILYFNNGFRPSTISNINRYSPYFALFDKPPKKKPLYNVIEHTLEWGFVPHEKYSHPSPKTASVFAYFIEGFDAKTVLDPFLGSGCTAEAAEMLGNVNWLGFEIEKKYEDDINRRIVTGKENRKSKRSVF